jgi:hypothetical protein
MDHLLEKYIQMGKLAIRCLANNDLPMYAQEIECA